MSDHANDGMSDAQLDAALRTLLAREDTQVDLRVRVLASIDTPVARLDGPRRRVVAGPALALAAAALVLISALALWWSASTRDAAPAHSRYEVRVIAREAKHVAERTTGRQRNQTPTPETPADGQAVPRRPVQRVHMPQSPAMDRTAESWDAALPPLAAPEPLAVERMDERPIRVAGLSIDQLAINPLRLDPLDRLREE
jgi:hypothetical protein